MELIVSIFFAIVVIATYTHARGLFFRNDEWHYMKKCCDYLSLKNLQQKIKLLFYDIWCDKQKPLIHIHPLSLLSLYEKFRILKGSYSYHLFVSIVFHALNCFLVFWISLNISSDIFKATLASVMFGLCGLIADTIFWAGSLAFIKISTLVLLTIYLHPEFNNFSGGIALLMFFLITTIAPLVMELGYIALFIAIMMFLPNYSQNQLSIALLFFMLMGHLTVRAYFALKQISSLSSFIGVQQFLKNIIVANFKLIIGLFGGSFHHKITDTMYVLKVDYKHYLTIIAFLIFFTYLINAIHHKSLQFNTLCLVFIICAQIPFILTSINLQVSEPNKDLTHQMPRYFYLSSALYSIVIAATLIANTNPTIILLTGFFIAISGFVSIKNQVQSLRPFTDNLKERVLHFETTGILLENKMKTPSEYRLDWSFNEYSISAFYKIKMRGKIDLDPKTHNELGERLFNEGKIEEAKKAFVNAIVLDPNYSPAYNNLGVLYFSQEDYSSAIQYFATGLMKDTSNKELIVNFATFLCHLHLPNIPSQIRQMSNKPDLTNRELNALKALLLKWLNNPS